MRALHGMLWPLAQLDKYADDGKGSFAYYKQAVEEKKSKNNNIF